MHGESALVDGYDLEPLTGEEVSRWDELISAHPRRELFHRKVWLEYLEDSRGVEIRYWRIRRRNESIGYFCGGILRKGPFRILGSPLKGWGTNFLGPVADDSFAAKPFLSALDRLAEEEGIDMVELESRSLPEEALMAAGFEPVPDSTFLVRITPGDADAVWNAIESTCRNRVRKATKGGLTVENLPSPQMCREFYSQYVDLMRRKNLAPTYPADYPEKLVAHLAPAEMIFGLRVRDPAGRILATGLFPHDENTMYFWGGASWQEGRNLCPNEFLHWNAMRRAAECGLRLYNTCGTGQFKRKFGGEYAVTKRWHRFYSGSARWARRGYEAYFKNRIRIRGWLGNVARRRRRA